MKILHIILKKLSFLLKNNKPAKSLEDDEDILVGKYPINLGAPTCQKNVDTTTYPVQAPRRKLHSDNVNVSNNKVSEDKEKARVSLDAA